MTGAEHPFIQSLNDLSIEELNAKHSELMNRFRIARSMQMQPEVINQIDLMLNSIEEEKIRRTSVDDQPNGVIIETDSVQITKFDPKK